MILVLEDLSCPAQRAIGVSPSGIETLSKQLLQQRLCQAVRIVVVQSLSSLGQLS